MSRSNDYTTGNFFDFNYFKKDYRLIAIDLSEQTKLKDPQQINSIGRRKTQDNNNSNGATMFFIIEKSEETTFEFLQNSVNINQKIVNLLSGSENEFLKFATKKWYVIDSESNGSYSHQDPIKFLTSQ